MSSQYSAYHVPSRVTGLHLGRVPVLGDYVC